MTSRGLVAAVAAVVIAVALWWTLSDAAHAPEPVLMTAPKEPAPPVRPSPAPLPQPPVRRTYHLPPPGAEPPAPRPPQPVAVMDLETQKDFQRITHRAMRDAEAECVKPWVEMTQEGAELVLDTVVQDGVVVDVELRALGELPEALVDCVRDVVWQARWPEASDAPGQLRFQHAMDVPYRDPANLLPVDEPNPHEGRDRSFDD